MTFTKAGHKKGTFLRKTAVGSASLLLAGAFLFGGGTVHANQVNNGSLARGDDYPYYYKNGNQENNFAKGVDWFCWEAYSSVLRC